MATDDSDADRTRVEARDPLLGAVVDRRFRIDERIAAGGFGAIYRATHVKSHHVVALKVLHPAMSSDARVVARFKREGATLTRLRNPHTVTTYELTEDAANGTLFMVMELLTGETLLERFRAAGALPWRRVVRIIRMVCESLAEAHALGVVHRDLKPANIQLERRGDEEDYVKVLDFGIAKLMEGSSIDGGHDELTRTNEVIGTFDYLSPEQIVGEAYSGRSDIYTLGVVMYEVITGTRPFPGTTGPALLATILHTAAPPPSSRLPGLPPALDAVILRCLDRDPNRRPADVGELAAALDRLLEAADGSVTRALPVLDAARASEADATWVAEAPSPPIPAGPPVPDAAPYAAFDGWVPPTPEVPNPLFELAPDSAHDQFVRRVTWAVVLGIAIVIGIAVAALV